MASKLALSRAAQAWGKPKTKKKVMDVQLCEAFAEILDDVWSKSWLGNATTRELLEEIKARIEVSGELDYRTVGIEEGTS